MLMRFASVVVSLLSVACATPTRDLTEEFVRIGNFRLGNWCRVLRCNWPKARFHAAPAVRNGCRP